MNIVSSTFLTSRVYNDGIILHLVRKHPVQFLGWILLSAQGWVHRTISADYVFLLLDGSYLLIVGKGGPVVADSLPLSWVLMRAALMDGINVDRDHISVGAAGF